MTTKRQFSHRVITLLAAACAVMASASGYAGGGTINSWGPSAPLERADGSQVPGGCPIESPAGKFLFVAKNPTGSNIDIYVNSRTSLDAPFEGDDILAPVISDPGANDFCPTPLRDGLLYFVSTRTLEAPDAACGGADIYWSVNNPATGYDEPTHLACHPHGPNTPGAEFSPSVIESLWGTFLFYSSDYLTGNQDIYVSTLRADGTFGPGHRLGYPINTEYDDKQPNVSPDGREIVFASNRPGANGVDSAFDIYTAKRRVQFFPWTEVVNLSETVPFDSEPADESRPSFSWDGTRMVYGSGGVWLSERRRR